MRTRRFLSCALLLLASASFAQTWEIEVLDDGKQFSDMTDRSLRLDAAGRPHIAYGADKLYYSWHGGDQWHCEVADPSPGVGRFASLVLDTAGHPHISYYDDRNGDLRYARLVPAQDGGARTRPAPAGLLSVSPNPFGQSADLRWMLSRAGHVDVSVFDLLGRRVAVLADGVAGGGTQQLRWSPVGLPSGAYVLRVSLDGTTAAVQPLIYTR
jgi:hypothetical protein